MPAKPDIKTREDIIQLVDHFYSKVRDSDIGYIFNDIAKVDWEAHLPTMYNFWCSTLIGEKGYSGSPVPKHIALNKQIPLGEKEFSSWLSMFTATVDELFEGSKAEEAKLRATSIAAIMKYKVAASS